MRRFLKGYEDPAELALALDRMTENDRERDELFVKVRKMRILAE